MNLLFKQTSLTPTIGLRFVAFMSAALAISSAAKVQFTAPAALA